MCFTLSFEKKAKEKIHRYLKANPDVQSDFDFEEDYYLVSGFSHPLLPVIRQDKIGLAAWGLIPSFANSEELAQDMRTQTLNARSDTIHEKRSFKLPIKNQRCVLAVDGFYEWQHLGNTKTPYYIFPKNDSVYYFGCIYNPWVNRQTGEMTDTFSIITTDANPLMEVIHNTKKRMPLILPESGLHAWINPTTAIEEIDSMMIPFPETEMDAYPVSKNAGNSRINRNFAGIKERMDSLSLF